MNSLDNLKLMDREQLGKIISEMDVTDMVKNYTDAVNERRCLSQVYYNTGELDYDLQWLLEWMKLENLTRFTTDGIFYESMDIVHYNMSISLMKIVDGLQDVKPFEFKDNTTDFPETGIIYEGCKLSMMFGQGTLYCIEVM